MSIYSLIGILDFVFIVGFVVFKKLVIDSDHFLSKNPYFKASPIKAALFIAIFSQTIPIFNPGPLYVSLSWITFNGAAIFAGVLILKNYKKQTKLFLISYMGRDLYLKIPFDKYITVGKGVRDRRLRSPEDIQTELEAKYKDTIKDLDFENNEVIFVEFDDNVSMKFNDDEFHKHDFDEQFLMLEGSARMFENKWFDAGDKVFIPANTPHCFDRSKKGCCLIMIPKTKTER